MALLLFALLTWQVAADGPLRAADERLGDAMRGGAPPEPAAEVLADLGNMAVALPVAVSVMAWAVIRTRQWLSVLCQLLALVAVPLLVSLLKVWIDRPGPLEGSGYYPSGHAATAAVAFGGAALLLRSEDRRRWLFTTAVSTAALLTLLNGAGLVWRGYHWPTDVLASWCLSWLLLTAATTASRRALRRSGPPPSIDPGRG